MRQEINPKETSRATAFELWMKSPMPMVTLTKTFDVTRLCKMSRRRGLKFNMLLCWCIGKAASRIEEFYMLPHNGKLYKYIVGTSAVTGTELDSIVNQYSGIYNNPFLAWGRYRKGWLKTTLPISFQFHHAQMDGSHAARFLEELQKAINTI